MGGRRVKKRKTNIASSWPYAAVVLLVLSYKHQEALESLLNISSFSLYLFPSNTAGHSSCFVTLVCPDSFIHSVQLQRCTWDTGQQYTSAQHILNLYFNNEQGKGAKNTAGMKEFNGNAVITVVIADCCSMFLLSVLVSTSTEKN